MSRMARLLRGWRARHDQMSNRCEAGTTMVELFAAMTLMTICGTIFIGALVSLYKAANQAQAVTASGQQTNQAYQTLDRSVRYASAITAPAKSTGAGATGDWYVEWRNTAQGVENCSQLRVDLATGQLQRRTWLATNTTSQPVFIPLASGVVNAAADQPFLVPYNASSTAVHQVLTVTLVTKSGPASNPVQSRSQFDLTALNSSNKVPDGSICQQWGRP